MLMGTPFHGLQAYGLRLQFSVAARGSGFAGAAWRGLLGQALSDAVCSYPVPACATCPSVASCAYPKLFKPVADAVLPPFWLHDWRRGRDQWSVDIRWLGADNGFAVGEWLAALSGDGAGLSFGGETVRLDRALAPVTAKPAWRPGDGWMAVPAALTLADGTTPPPACRVRFVTPLVSKHAGDPLFGALYTRLQRLVQQHGDGADLPRPAAPWRCRVLAHKEMRIPLARRLLAGTQWDLELSGINADAWTMLRAGVELHAGGQTGMGCGHYEILPAVAV